MATSLFTHFSCDRVLLNSHCLTVFPLSVLPSDSTNRVWSHGIFVWNRDDCW